MSDPLLRLLLRARITSAAILSSRASIYSKVYTNFYDSSERTDRAVNPRMGTTPFDLAGDDYDEYNYSEK